MKKLLSKTLVIIASAVFLFSCDRDNLEFEKGEIKILKNEVSDFEVTSSLNIYTFHFTAEKLNGKIKSKLQISKTGNSEIELVTNNETDIDANAYKLVVHKGVVAEAAAIQNKIGLNDLKVLSTEFESFAKSLLVDERVNYSSELIQAIFFHNAILNTSKRSSDGNKDCKCTPHPGYFTDKTPFWCQEDYIVNTKRFLNAIESSQRVLNETELKLYNFLKDINKKQQFVTSDILFDITENNESFLERVESQYLVANGTIEQSVNSKTQACTKGSDLGCCGNYSGCCWYWSIYCLDHDIECFNCDHWHCGWDCKPGLA